MKIFNPFAVLLITGWLSDSTTCPELTHKSPEHEKPKTSLCLEDKKVRYGGDFKAHNYTYFCPAYQFAYDGDVSKSWNILNPIDIRQVATTLLPVKKKVEQQIRDYAGNALFSKLRFSSADVVYTDSINKFAGRVPEVDMKFCKAKYYFYYTLQADAQAVFNIGFAANKQGFIISPFDIPAKRDYAAIDTTLNVCRILAIARKYNPKIDPIAEVTFDYDSKSKRFYWLVSQKIINSHEGANTFNQVKIDAARPSKVEKLKGEVTISY
jgi:hypothetical protein